VIVLLACVLALDAADKGLVGAIAPELIHDLQLSGTALGALPSASAGMGAVAALPAGMLTDRMHRVGLLTGSVVVWSVALVAGGLAHSFLWLLLSRLALGAIIAAAGPAVASLVGDFFPPAERGHIYGMLLSGEVLGTGLGLLAGHAISSLLSWRYAFWFLALLGFAVAWTLRRRLPEPPRGGQDRLERPGGPGGEATRDDTAKIAASRRHIAPDPALVLHRDPARMPIAAAVRYVLRVPTNIVLIVASAVGYFFFAGLRTFGIVFAAAHYGLGTGQVTLVVVVLGVGILAGVLSGGRVADRLVRRGLVPGRVLVSSVAFVAGAVCLLPVLLTETLRLAFPLAVLAAAFLGAANPPLDAARLDIMHYRLWGRAESVRMFLRTGAETSAPLLFGAIADALGGRGGADSHGLQLTFLIMLVPLLANGVILLQGIRTYPRDVATAAASEEATRAA
jgi:predicted MFS family arabinose efflux permease